MNAEEAVDILNRHVAGAVTFHPLSTFSEIAALIRSQADDLKAIEKCARIDGGFMAWELADKTIMVEHGFNIEPGTGRRGIGATVADALANTTAPKAN